MHEQSPPQLAKSSNDGTPHERRSRTSSIMSSASTRLSRDKTQIPPCRSEARRRGRGPAWHWLTAQNLSIGTLKAARNCRVPTLDLCGWLKAQSCSAAMCKFFDKAYCLPCPKAVSLKRQRAKIKRMHPAVSVCFKNWMISTFFFFFFARIPTFVACFLLSNLASCLLAARVSVRVS